MIDRKWDFHMNFAFSEFSHFSICFPGYLQDVCVSFLFFCWSLHVLFWSVAPCMDSDHWSSPVFSWFIIYFLICLVCILIYRYITFLKILLTLSVLYGSDIMHSDRILPISQSPEFALRHCTLFPQTKQNLKKNQKAKTNQQNKNKTKKNLIVEVVVCPCVFYIFI